MPDPEEEEDAGEEEDAIRCICGDDNPKDKRAFIGCDACTVWQHNVCMGMPEDDEEVPDHYFCEECRPEEHKETLAALAEGRKIWETRTNLCKQWKKMSASRKMTASKRRSQGKAGEERAPWLKKDDVDVDQEAEAQEKVEENEEAQETGIKRKRDSVKPESEPLEGKPHSNGQSAPAARPDKRRKSSQAPAKTAAPSDSNTAVVEIDQLPSDRRKVAQALSKIITDDVSNRVKSGQHVPNDHPGSPGDHFASLIEYALFMNYDQPTSEKYKTQFRALNANLKKNKLLIERLLNGSLTPDDLATMESKDMASEELQRERVKMKEDLDRQAVMVQEEGPRVRRTHKGDEIIEDESFRPMGFGNDSAPVRERTSIDGGGAGSPMNGAAGSPRQPSQTPIDTRRPSMAGKADASKRHSSQQFDAQKIWGPGPAQSPATGSAGMAPRPMQMPPRRRSSVAQHDGTKEDADVDRMLQDDDNEGNDYAPSADSSIVWRGRVIHVGEGEPVVSARFVAGRDLANETPATGQWTAILPHNLSIDGRLQIDKAEEYLCGLQWSHSSDVSVLALTPWDDSAAFNAVFEYFKTRSRYAVVNKDKPKMIRDLYIIPVEAGVENLPEHIEKLEYCNIKLPTEERLLLATLVVNRSQEKPGHAAGGSERSASVQYGQPSSGSGMQGIPQHLRPGAQGPGGSPVTANSPTFPPQPPQQMGTPFPPNPYMPGAANQQAQQVQTMASPQAFQFNPLIAEILGPFVNAPSAVQVVTAEPNIGREKLINLRRIFEEHEPARNSLEALAAQLVMPGPQSAQ